MTKLIDFLAFMTFLTFCDCFPTFEDEIVDRISPENLLRLKNLKENDLAEELSGQFQGDIILTSHQKMDFMKRRESKAGLRNTTLHWLNGIVPYRVTEEHFTPEQVVYIHFGARRLEEVTCLKFIAYDQDVHKDFIDITGNSSGCFSSVGRRGGRQILNLQPFSIETGCFRLMTIAHEFIHAVGFFHMQSATERDDFVRVLFENIIPGSEHNFNIYGFETVTNLNVEYDYGSVMHYSRSAFSIDGSDTIIPLRSLNGEAMGQRVRLSSRDISRINRMYCGEEIESTSTSESTTETSSKTTTEAETTSQPRFPETIRSVIELIKYLLRIIFGRV